MVSYSMDGSAPYCYTYGEDSESEADVLTVPSDSWDTDSSGTPSQMNGVLLFKSHNFKDHLSLTQLFCGPNIMRVPHY